MSFLIEPMETPESGCLDTLPLRIFQEPGIALAASGSLACLRTLYFQAKQTGKLPFFFWAAPTARDYSLGRQGGAILNIIKHAANTRGVRGVIFYASCMEVLTVWDFEGELEHISSELQVPVRILYRGPLVKRLFSPAKTLESILADWADQPALSEGLPLRTSEDCPPPPRPDFELLLAKLSQEDCDALLFTPGGCKKCLAFDRFFTLPESFQSSRFDDVFLGSGNMAGICRKVLDAFPDDRPLYLLTTAVPYAAGIDLGILAEELRRKGKQVVCPSCNGFTSVEIVL